MELKDIINNSDNYELKEHADGGYLITAKGKEASSCKGDTPEAGNLYVLEVDRLDDYKGNIYYHNGIPDGACMVNISKPLSKRRITESDRWRCIGTIEELMKKAGVV